MSLNKLFRRTSSQRKTLSTSASVDEFSNVPIVQLNAVGALPLEELVITVTDARAPAARLVASKNLSVSVLAALHFTNSRNPSQGESSRASLLANVKTVLNVSDSDFADYSKQAETVFQQGSQATGIRLHIRGTLISAADLMAKDSNGKSDPFAVIECIPSVEGSSRFTSAIIKESLNPTWNQQFELPLNDNCEELLVTLWDDDTDQTAGSSVKGMFSSFGRGIRDLKQSLLHQTKDDFLGVVAIAITSIPAEGVTQTFPLEKRSDKSNVSGTVTLRLGLDYGSDFDETRVTQSALDLYFEFLTLLIAIDAIEFAGTNAGGVWDGTLAPFSRSLLHQLAFYLGIGELHKTCVGWRALAQHSITYKNAVGPLRLAQLLEEIIDLLDKRRISDLEAAALAATITDFYQHHLSNIKNMFGRFDVSKDGGMQAGYSIILAKLCHSVKLWKKGEGRTIDADVAAATQAALEAHFATVQTLSAVDQKIQGHKIVVAVKTVTTLSRHLDGLKSFFARMFSKANVDIVSMALTTFNKQVAALIEATSGWCIDESKVADLGMLPFELYFAAKNYEKQARTLLDPSLPLSLRIFENFLQLVADWISRTQSQSDQWLKRAIELDKAVPISTKIKMSSSIVDVFRCLHDVVEFWHRLDWSREVAFKPLQSQLIQVICRASEAYAAAIKTKLDKEGYCDVDGQFDINETLCTYVNNIVEASHEFSDLAENLGESDMRQKGLFPESLENFDSTRKNIQTILQSIYQGIATKMRADLRVFTKKILPPADVVLDEARCKKNCTALLDYLCLNLGSLNEWVHSEILNGIVLAIWNEVLVHVQELVLPAFEEQKLDRKTCAKLTANSSRSHKAATLALAEIFSFFFQDGEGLSKESLTSAKYSQLLDLLHLSEQATPALVQRYLDYEIRDEWPFFTTKGKLGSITFAASWKPAVAGKSSTVRQLSLTLLALNKLVGRDLNGKCDPYCVVNILPVARSKSKEVKTKHHSNVLDLKLSDSLTFDIDGPTDGLAIHIMVLDHDFLSKDDPLGEIVVGLERATDAEHQGREISCSLRLGLPVAPTVRDAVRLVELRRFTDATAAAFIEARKNFFFV
eukprot:m.878958 g.878958  ORF g.878958 m.878958 type:complete len:1094 (-) comp59840_c0_seq2:1948-5229(-)